MLDALKSNAFVSGSCCVKELSQSENWSVKPFNAKTDSPPAGFGYEWLSEEVTFDGVSTDHGAERRRCCIDVGEQQERGGSRVDPAGTSSRRCLKADEVSGL